MLPNTAATMRQSSAVPTTAGSTVLIPMEMLVVAGILLEGVASERLLTGGVTADDCDDGVSAEYVDTVEQFVRNTVSSESQHILFSLLQIVQALLVANVILMMIMSLSSFISTMHHQDLAMASPAVVVILWI